MGRRKRQVSRPINTATSRTAHDTHVLALNSGISLLDALAAAIRTGTAPVADNEIGAIVRDAERDWQDEDTLEAMSTVLDEQANPPLEFTLGVLGAKPPAGSSDRARALGTRAFSSALRNRKIARKREGRRVAANAAVTTAGSAADISAKASKTKKKEAPASAGAEPNRAAKDCEKSLDSKPPSFHSDVIEPAAEELQPAKPIGNQNITDVELGYVKERDGSLATAGQARSHVPVPKHDAEGLIPVDIEKETIPGQDEGPRANFSALKGAGDERGACEKVIPAWPTSSLPASQPRSSKAVKTMPHVSKTGQVNAKESAASRNNSLPSPTESCRMLKKLPAPATERIESNVAKRVSPLIPPIHGASKPGMEASSVSGSNSQGHFVPVSTTSPILGNYTSGSNIGLVTSSVAPTALSVVTSTPPPPPPPPPLPVVPTTTSVPLPRVVSSGIQPQHRRLIENEGSRQSRGVRSADRANASSHTMMPESAPAKAARVAEEAAEVGAGITGKRSSATHAEKQRVSKESPLTDAALSFVAAAKPAPRKKSPVSTGAQGGKGKVGTSTTSGDAKAAPAASAARGAKKGLPKASPTLGKGKATLSASVALGTDNSAPLPALGTGKFTPAVTPIPRSGKRIPAASSGGCAGKATPAVSSGVRVGKAAPAASPGSRGGKATSTASSGPRPGKAAPAASPGLRTEKATPAASPGLRAGKATSTASSGPRAGKATPAVSSCLRAGKATAAYSGLRAGKAASIVSAGPRAVKATPTACPAESTGKSTLSGSSGLRAGKATPSASPTLSAGKATPAGSPALATGKSTPASSPALSTKGGAPAVSPALDSGKATPAASPVSRPVKATPAPSPALSASGRAARERRALGLGNVGITNGIVRSRGRRSSGVNEGELYVKDGNVHMLKCYAVWKKYNADKISIPFRKPVAARDAPGYYDVVKEPMDLHSIHSLFENGTMSTPREFARVMRLIYKNAMQYNPPYSDVYDLADELRHVILKEVTPVIAAWKAETGAESDSADDEDARVVVKKAKIPAGGRGRGRGRGRGGRGRGRGRGRTGAGRVAGRSQSDGDSDAVGKDDEEGDIDARKRDNDNQGHQTGNRRDQADDSSDEDGESSNESDDDDDIGNGDDERSMHVKSKKRRKSELDATRHSTRREAPPGKKRKKMKMSIARRKNSTFGDPDDDDEDAVDSDEDEGDYGDEMKLKKRKFGKKKEIISRGSGGRAARGRGRGRGGFNASGSSSKAKREGRQGQTEGSVKRRRRQS